MANFPLTAASLLKLLPSALEMSAEEGTRVLSLLRLIELLDIQKQLVVAPGSGENADLPATARASALVDASLRSARLLRASVREHRAVIGASKRTRRGLRELEGALSEMRRTRAQFELLAMTLESDDRGAAEEARTLRDRLAHRLPAAHDVQRAFARHLDPLQHALGSQLLEYAERRVVGQPPTRRSLAAHLAARVSKGAAALEADFADGRYGRMRTRLVHQQAMLMPFAQRHPAIGEWYHRTGSAHVALRMLRDIDALADLAASRRLPALQATLEAEGDALLTSFQRTWSEATTASVKAAVDVLDGSAAASALPVERERKFLLRASPDEIAGVDPIRIEQGWLPGTVLRERLRRSEYADGRIVLTRTVKAGPLGARVELEEVTTPELFDALWPHTQRARIRKRRYPVREGRFVWEIDVFSDRELVLAEVELTQSADLPALPAWLAPFVVREVTDESAYTNSDMATPDPDSDGSLSA